MRRSIGIRGVEFLLAVALVSSAVGLVAYEVGGRQGFRLGFSAGSAHRDVYFSARSVSALTLLRDGEVDRATMLLEQSVDSGVITYWARSLDSSRFASAVPLGPPNKPIRSIVRYRRTQPPFYVDGETGEMFRRAFASLEEIAAGEGEEE